MDLKGDFYAAHPNKPLRRRRDLVMRRRLRIGMGIASLLLFGTEILIGMYAHGWVRDQLGDFLVVILIYTLWRMFAPEKPRHGLLLPAGILLFAFCVEFLQLWAFCDRLHITNKLLRIIIGTGYSNADMLSYALGILPCIACELLLRRTGKKHAEKQTAQNPAGSL